MKTGMDVLMLSNGAVPDDPLALFLCLETEVPSPGGGPLPIRGSVLPGTSSFKIYVLVNNLFDIPVNNDIISRVFYLERGSIDVPDFTEYPQKHLVQQEC